MSDVEGTQFLVSQSQKPKDVHVVLVSPNEPTEQPPQGRATPPPWQRSERQRGDRDSDFWALPQQTTGQRPGSPCSVGTRTVSILAGCLYNWATDGHL